MLSKPTSHANTFANFTLDHGKRRMMKITAVIPYYQRESGLLTRAVASIAAQSLPANCSVEIIIVDDGSPAPALAENLEPLPANQSLLIVKQNNSGVGAARNAGINAADRSTCYLAFLDSDDLWEPLHLVSAIEQLDNGADFYFDNNIIDDGIDAFSHFEYMKATHGELNLESGFLGFMEGDVGFRAILHECIPHTSQVVYNFQRFSDVRFDTQMLRAGEDQLFWLTLASRSTKIAYSTAINGRRGVGVSIYRESLAWDSVNGLSRVVDEIVMRTLIARRFDLDQSQRRLLRSDAQAVCDHFIFLAVRNAWKQPRQLIFALTRLTRESPSFWAMAPRSVFGLPGHVRQLRAMRRSALVDVVT